MILIIYNKICILFLLQFQTYSEKFWLSIIRSNSWLLIIDYRLKINTSTLLFKSTIDKFWINIKLKIKIKIYILKFNI